MDRQKKFLGETVFYWLFLFFRCAQIQHGPAAFRSERRIARWIGDRVAEAAIVDETEEDGNEEDDTRAFEGLFPTGIEEQGDNISDSSNSTSSSDGDISKCQRQRFLK